MTRYLSLCVVALAACGSSPGPAALAPATLEMTGCGGAAAPMPAPPSASLVDPALLCKLTIGVSTPEDARKLLGQPDGSSDNGTSVSLWYGGDLGEPRLSLGFAGYIFSYAAVDDGPYPACWTEQLRALGGDLPDAGVNQ